MGKIWKNGGSEDKFIEKQIKNGKINKYTKPQALQANHPKLFGEFTVQVIRNHLNLLKRSNGLYLDGDSDEENEEDNDLRRNETVNGQDGDGNKSSSDEMVISGFNLINHQNYPVICELYKDPETQCDKVIMVITMPAGAKNVSVEITNDGIAATIKYQWSKTMYDMSDLYGKMLTRRQITVLHPKILAIKNGLEKYRHRIDAAPESVIKVYFPIKVQTSAESWSKFGVARDDGTQIMVIDLAGYVKNYSTKISDSIVTFD